MLNRRENVPFGVKFPRKVSVHFLSRYGMDATCEGGKGREWLQDELTNLRLKWSSLIICNLSFLKLSLQMSTNLFPAKKTLQNVKIPSFDHQRVFPCNFQIVLQLIRVFALSFLQKINFYVQSSNLFNLSSELQKPIQEKVSYGQSKCQEEYRDAEPQAFLEWKTTTKHNSQGIWR